MVADSADYDALVALADELAAFDCVEDEVPGGIDVPDDYEAGLHEAAARLRAALAHLIPPDLCPTCRETLPCLTCGAGL